jgi:hypothetical protein
MGGGEVIIPAVEAGGGPNFFGFNTVGYTDDTTIVLNRKFPNYKRC